MEVAVRGHDVLVTTHKTYCESREAGNGIQAVTQYPPFQRFIADCEARGPAPRAITIRNIQRIAHRVVGVMADVEYADEHGRVATQSIHLKDGTPAVLLPIAHGGDRQFAILQTQRRVAASMNLTKEAYTGQLADDGLFVCEEASTLTQLGFDLSTARRLGGGRTFTIGDEGQAACTVLTVSTSMSPEQLRSLQEHTSQPGVSAPVAVPLEVVSSIDDAKTSLAACLLRAEMA